MIRLTRLNGSQMWLNADLIASVEELPDTTVTLVDGRHLVVRETPDDVAEQLIQFRASILAVAEEMLRPAPDDDDQTSPENKMYLLPTPSDAEQV